MARTRARRVVVVATLLACAAIASPAGANLTSGCVGRFDAGTDYFPDKISIEDAANFRVEYQRSYKLVTVAEAYSGGPSERYVLVQCGTPPPALTGTLQGAQIVTVPITALFAASVTHVPLVDQLGRIDVLAGVSRLRDLPERVLASRAAAGGVREFAAAGVVDAELVVSGRPGLFMTGGSASAALTAIRAAGVPVVANTEWLEPNALGRAEWLKYMALFLNEERKARDQYAATKTRYQAVRARAMAVPSAARPLVMTGRSTRGTFVIAGGRSYVAALIADAGGRYVWADNPSAGAPSVDLEAQIQRAGRAAVWINGGGWQSLAAMIADEPRYAELEAYRRGEVWVYERRMTPSGGNDYWSRSVSRPDLVLADLVKIFHPALMSDHEFEWYVRVRPR